MPITIETLQEFVARHGQSLRIGTTFYFPDGATLHESGQIRNEPPANKFARLRLVKMYLEEKLKIEKAKFNSLQAALEEQAQLASRYAVPGPDENGPEVLRQIRGKYLRIKLELTGVVKQLEQSPEAIRRREREEAEEEGQMEMAALLSEISSVTLDD